MKTIKKTAAALLSLALLLVSLPMAMSVSAETAADAFTYTVRNDDTVSITKYIGEDTDVVIPAAIDGKPVTVIGERAFSRKPIETVVLPDGLKQIWQYAFSNCTALQSSVIPDSVEWLASCVFEGCTSLRTAVLPEEIRTLGGGVFSGCESLETVKMPRRFSDDTGLRDQRIGHDMFFGCKSLQSIQFPENVYDLDGGFTDCDSLRSVTLKGIQKIITVDELPIPGRPDPQDIIFKDCDQLESIVIPNTLESLSDILVVDCPNFKDIYYLGTKEEWDTLGVQSTQIMNATVHFFLAGDVDWDGEVTSGDMRTIFASLLSETPLPDEQFFAADVSGDGEVTMADIRCVMTNMVGTSGGCLV